MLTDDSRVNDDDSGQLHVELDHDDDELTQELSLLGAGTTLTSSLAHTAAGAADDVGNGDDGAKPKKGNDDFAVNGRTFERLRRWEEVNTTFELTSLSHLVTNMKNMLDITIL